MSKKLIGRNPVVAILGARQVGKTTLARNLIEAQQRPATFAALRVLADRPRKPARFLVSGQRFGRAAPTGG